MASSSGNSASSEMDQRKRKRMQSNRESARRSRQRKQKHLDDLMAQVGQLQRENAQISSSVNVTTEQFLNVEAENAVLRAQMMELTHRLQSLNAILNCVSSGAGAGGSCMVESEEFHHLGSGDAFFNGSWNSMGLSHHHLPIMAEMFDY